MNVYSKENPNKRLTLYPLIDDQSNVTLAKSELFDYMGVPNFHTHFFTLTSCAGRIHPSGRKISGLIMATKDRYVDKEQPIITECNEIPNEKREIPTLEVITNIGHLQSLPIPPPRTHKKKMYY